MQYGERELPDLAGDVGVGATLGPYELLVPIARGGMASVWAARLKGPRGFQKLVALKVMLPVLSDDPRFEKMFLAEAEYASRIRHPNVASIVDLGEQDGRLFIAMEWVDGEPLNAIRHVAGAEAGFVPVPLAVRIAVDAAMGLHAAHELTGARGENLGLVHCDVSPQNILVTFDGLVKVVDFGLAKATAVARTSHEEEALIGGKLSYMSPEQASGATVDRRTDIFALGIVVYEMITGRHPFQADTALATLQRIRDDLTPIPTPAELCAECPRAVSDAIMSALDRDPARRFQTMLAFGRTLERALGELPGGRRRDDLARFVTDALGERARRRRAAIADATRDDDAPPPRTAPIPPPSPGEGGTALSPPPPPSSQSRAWTEDRDVVEPVERLPASTAPMAMSERPPPRRRLAALAAAAIGLAVRGLSHIQI